jgi:SAM-dependent methyltransferase
VLRVGKHTLWKVRRRVDFALAHLPFFVLTERLHDEEFFRAIDAAHAAMYDVLAESLWDFVRPASVVDVGCGSGSLLERFQARGATVRGLEGSRHAIAMSPVADRIVPTNLEHELPDLGRFDLAVCIEVGQNISPRHARRLVTGIARLSDLVLFTSAQPGQGGRGHVNEQPPGYWRDLFAEHGFRQSAGESALRARIAGVPEPRWLHANLLLLERAQATSSST